MARGYNGFDSVLRFRDGVPANDVWAEAQAALTERNAQRDRWVQMLTVSTPNVAEDVWQLGDDNDVMEEASEFGLPTSVRTEGTVTTFGTPGKWYDRATRVTQKALMDMTSQQFDAITNAALEQSDKTIYKLVMERVFNPSNVAFTEKGGSYTNFAFWNGDGVVPPTYNGNSFDGTHTHYRTTANASVESADLDDILADFKSHGFGPENGNTLLLFVNPLSEGPVIRGFRHASGDAEDFVPSSGSRFFTTDTLYGTQPSATWGPWAVAGAYSDLLVIEDTRIPTGYMVALVSGGSNMPTNPLNLRVHDQRPGLQLFGGDRTDYPLVDSEFSIFTGASVRQRGAGIVYQVTENANYTAPSALVI